MKLCSTSIKQIQKDTYWEALCNLCLHRAKTSTWTVKIHKIIKIFGP